MAEDKKKFLFHLHNFGEPEEEDGPPPPPMFSEEELAAAKNKAYEQGKQDGFAESQQSVEKTLETLLTQAQNVFLDLQSKEALRERHYEEEAVRLGQQIFKSIYPAWVEDKGEAEIARAIEGVLQQVSSRQALLIEVAPDLLASVKDRFESAEKNLSHIGLNFKGNEALHADEMRMSWEHGGAVRDSKALVEQILHILEEDMPMQAERDDPQEEENTTPLAHVEETAQNETIKDTETPDE